MSVTTTRRLLAPARLTSTTVRAFMDALPSSAAVVDEDGVILTTNRAWKSLVASEGADPRRAGAGQSYLEICDQAADSCQAAADFGRGLREILSGQIETFEVDDRMVREGQTHVVRGRATRIEEPTGTWVLITHQDLSRPADEAA